MNNRNAFLVLACASLASPALAVPQTLNFDDISGTPTVTQYLNPNVAAFTSYGGLNWAGGWAVVNGFAECGVYDCGFKYAQTSGSFTATNIFSGGTGTITAPSPFRLLSIQLGSAWYDPLKIFFVGKVGLANVWSLTVDVTPYQATQVLFPTTLIDGLEVTPAISGPHVYTLGSGPRIVMDDFRLDLTPASSAPEPANWALLITGFGLVGVTARRRRQKRQVAA
jgi:hypothetical protein